MSFNGTLKRVADQGGKWGVLIDTDEKGETWFTLWDKKFAGQDSAEHKAVCDVHDWKGKRVTFEAERGKLKDKDGPDDGERWNSNITEITLESASELAADLVEEVAEAKREPSQTPSSVHPAQVVAEYNTARLSRLGLEAVQADMRAHEARAAWFAEVERVVKEGR